MGSGSSKLAHQLDIPAQAAQAGVPQTLHMKYISGWSSMDMHVSAVKDGPALYSVALPGAYRGDMILCVGPSADQAPIVRSHRSSYDFTLSLPSISAYGVPPLQVKLAYGGTFHQKHTFAMAVGYGQAARQETFVWKHSSGPEVQSLGVSSSGWKLERQASGEVVAVFDEGSGLSKNVGVFQFRGSGATGELGFQWSLMAFMAALCIYQLNMKVAVSAAT